MRKRRFLWVVLIPFILVLIGLLLLVYFFIASSFEQSYISEKEQELSKLGQIVITGYDKLYARKLTPEAEDFFSEIARQAEMRVTVVSMEGVVLFDSEKDARIMENHATRPEIKSALYGTKAMSIRYSYELKLHMMYVGLPLEVDNRVEGVVRVSYPLAGIKHSIDQFIYEIILAGVISLIFFVIIVYIISRQIASSLEHMRQGAEEYSKGNYGYKVEHSDIYEISRTSDTLNHMAREIGEKITALDKERREKNLVLESMTEGVVAINHESYVMYANQAAERIFERFDEFKPGALLYAIIRVPEIHRLVDDCIEGKVDEAEKMLELLPSEKNILVRVMRLNEEAGILLVFNDLTKILRLEQTRQDFVANVSHELRTPITSVVGFVETLLDGAVEDKESAVRFLNIIFEQSKRMAQIIDDLLILSRLDSGVEMAKEKLPLGMVISSSIALTNDSYMKKKITVDYSYKGSEEIYCNSHFLEQAIINLLTNAVRYSESGSKVNITVEIDKRIVKISVKDSGIGIAKEFHERIFERFFRTDKARSRNEGGTGLGLSIVKHIAMLHNGRVELDSAVGRGSTFSLVLPIVVK